MLDIRIENQSVRIGPQFAVRFQRTLRVPNDGQLYPLPPGLGAFPIFRVADYASRLPSEWREAGGVFIPLYQREALWLAFHGAAWRPNAVMVTIGGVNAVSGEVDAARLSANPQNYIVCPQQPWLDGINAGQGFVRQFVAMPLGEGATIEAAVAGREEKGGLQLTVFEPKPGRFPDEPPPKADLSHTGRLGAVKPMGLGAGGKLKQKIYVDTFGLDTWDVSQCATLRVHLVNSAQFREVTGQAPPAPPIDAALYAKHGLPWFDLYDEEFAEVSAPRALAEAPSIAGVGEPPLRPGTLPVTTLPRGLQSEIAQPNLGQPPHPPASSFGKALSPKKVI